MPTPPPGSICHRCQTRIDDPVDSLIHKLNCTGPAPRRTYRVTHDTGHLLAHAVNQDTVRKILTNLPPARCRVFTNGTTIPGATGPAWLRANP